MPEAPAAGQSRLRQHSTSAASGLTRTGSLAKGKSKRELLNKKRDELTKQIEGSLMVLPGMVDVEVRARARPHLLSHRSPLPLGASH